MEKAILRYAECADFRISFNSHWLAHDRNQTFSRFGWHSIETGSVEKVKSIRKVLSFRLIAANTIF